MGDFVGSLTSISDDKKARRFEQKEADREQATADFNRQNATADLDMSQDMALANYGELGSELIDPNLVVNTDASRFGPGLRDDLMASQGYQSWASTDPFMGQFGFARDAIDTRRDLASDYADQGIAGWEGAMQGIQDDYTSSAENIAGVRDERLGTAEGLIEDRREQRRGDEATKMLEDYIADGGRKKSRSAGSKFQAALRGLALGTAGGRDAGDRLGVGAGASEHDKREDRIASMRSAGLSDIEIAEQLAGDDDAGFSTNAYWS